MTQFTRVVLKVPNTAAATDFETNLYHAFFIANKTITIVHYRNRFSFQKEYCHFVNY